MDLEGRIFFASVMFVAMIGLLSITMVLIWLTGDAPCYEMRRLTESDTFTVCGDAVVTYLESGCCHVLGREER